MRLTATHIAYYHTCRRKLWLFHHGIQMEHSSELVYEGRLIGETSYEDRASRNTQVELGFPLEEGVHVYAVIDYFDPSAGILHETKKSDRMEEAHVAQVKFYFYLLKKSGVHVREGIIEYPKLRQRTFVPPLDEGAEREVEHWIHEVLRIVSQPQCPPVEKLPICSKCAYYEYCFADEE